MATFKDRNGKPWTIDLDAYLIRDVRKACDGLDLAALNGEAYDKLDADPVLLVDVLWILCASQANAASIRKSSSRVRWQAMPSAMQPRRSWKQSRIFPQRRRGNFSAR